MSKSLGFRFHRRSFVSGPQLASLEGALKGIDPSQPQKCQEIYTALLKSYAHKQSLDDARRLHAHMIQTGFDRLQILGNLLISTYGRCRDPGNSQRVFENLERRNIYSWISLVSAYAQNGHLPESWRAFALIPQRSIPCWNAMITALGQNDRAPAARELFDAMPDRETASWNSMIVGYAKNGHSREGFHLFLAMTLEGVEPDRITFLGVIDASGNLGNLKLARMIHEEILLSGEFQHDVFVGTAIVGMYGRCRSPDDAQRSFDSMSVKNSVSWTSLAVAYGQNGCLERALSVFEQTPDKTVVSWSAMVAAYAQNGHSNLALLVFKLMDLHGFCPNLLTFTSALDACASSSAIGDGRILHSEAAALEVDDDVHIGGALVSMYGSSGCCNEAKSVFDRLPVRNEVVATAMIGAYAEASDFPAALTIFRGLDLDGYKHRSITFVTILNACDDLRQGNALHERIIAAGLESHTITATALTCMYRRCKSLRDARSAFDKLLDKNVVSWTAMIVAYVENNDEREALGLFKKMDVEGTSPDVVILTTVLDACANISDLSQGRAIHRALEDGSVPLTEVATGLIDMYGKCGSVVDAKLVFNALEEQLGAEMTLPWTSMVTAFAQNGHGLEAVELFRSMELHGVEANEISLVSVLCACSHSGLITEGLSYFSSIEQDRGLALLPEHQVCWIDLLGRIGKLELAENAMESIPLSRDEKIIAWTAFLGACKTHDDERRAKRAAEKLVELDSKLSSSYIMLSNVHSLSCELTKLVKSSKAVSSTAKTIGKNILARR
ncbi:pentatricopeptide repeat-containing protein At2g13600 [Selaginella moellendorffii]|uniref:pentatricopeptide repeat-containing protein At2g13600 n=1 Tax=Selaginella moellendorffii TaxID=88036 RepID=UPI000D1CE776|nr:pentatricopeptide repeat-containing protein At2g13600 [Selaginella moellendorffii]|eukprot:XP_024538705.1 pentatricopeptide repeat-containing protein At2g13600 [Selaginella moellendorffii]